MEFAVDQLADLQHFVIRKLIHTLFGRDADFLDDLLRLGAADSVDVGQRNQHPLIRRDVNASDTRQGFTP